MKDLNNCRVCQSDKREFIESMILKGETNYAISKALKDMGIEIGHTTINRHKLKHMIDHIEKIEEMRTVKSNRKFDKCDNVEIDSESIFNSIEQEINDTGYHGMVKQYHGIDLNTLEILKNQLAIVLDLQTKYMAKQGSYPYEQIKGLQVTLDSLIKFRVFSKETLEELKREYENDTSDKDKIISAQADKIRFELEKDKKLWIEKYTLERELGLLAMDYQQWLERIPANLELSLGLKAKKVNFLQATIDRYRNEVCEKYKSKIPLGVENLCVNRLEAIENEIKEKEKIIENTGYLDIVKQYHTIDLLVVKIQNNELMILIDNQKRYMKGESKYPSEQIKGMQSTQEILIKFRNFSRDALEELKREYESVMSEKDVISCLKAERMRFQLERDKALWETSENVALIVGLHFKVLKEGLDGLPYGISVYAGITEEIVNELKNMVRFYGIELYKNAKLIIDFDDDLIDAEFDRIPLAECEELAHSIINRHHNP